MPGIFVLRSVKDDGPRLREENWLRVRSTSDALFSRGFALGLGRIGGFGGSPVLNFTISSLNQPI